MSAFNGDQFFEADVRRLVKTHGIETIVETGTNYGETTKAFAAMVERVYSVEADRNMFGRLIELGDGVTVYLGDSADVLPHLLPQLSKPLLLYLDAHGPGMPSPLIYELNAIARAKLKPIIIIHDFQNPERPEYGYDSYQDGPYNFNLIRPSLETIYGSDGYGYYYNREADGQKRGIIYIGPAPFEGPAPVEGPSTTVFYCTYHKDLCWIVYSLQILIKYLKGNYRIRVVAEPDCEDIIKTWGVPVKYTYHKPWPDGYAFAMYIKAMADQFCDTELVMILDSDHILTRPASVEDFLRDGKPIICYRHWDEDPNDASLIVGRQQWSPPTERVLGIKLDVDTMVGPPFIFWRNTFQAMRERIEDVTGLPFHDAVYSDKRYDYKNFLQHPKVFCDYESLGLYALRFEPERYHAIRRRPDSDWPFKVYWSHGWDQKAASELDALLRA